jgi:hypothetical protein
VFQRRADDATVIHWVVVAPNWTCGRLHLYDRLEINAGGSLTIGGGTFALGQLVGPGALTNSGLFASTTNAGLLALAPDFRWQNAGTFQHGAGLVRLDGAFVNQAGGRYDLAYQPGLGLLTVNGSFVNESGATFALAADALVPTGPGEFLNYGTLAKTGGAGTNTVAAPVRNLGGTLAVETGTLVLQLASSSNGTFQAAAGATLDLTGGATKTYSGSYAGTGLGVVQLASGEIDGIPSASLNLPNGFYWRGGTFGWTCINQGLMILDGAARKTTTGAVLNEGTVRQSGSGDLWLNTQSGFENQPGALYDVQTDGACVTGVGNAVFQNRGTVRKSLGAGTSSFDCRFQNLGGRIEVQTGTLVLNGPGNNTNGTFEVAAGATLDLTGGTTRLYNGVLSGAGLGVVQLASGEIDGDPSLTLSFANGFYWRGGTFGWTCVNQGLMILDGTTTRETTGAVENQGTIRHTGTGAFWLHGDPHYRYLFNRAGALYDVQADGTLVTGGSYGRFQNAGLVRKSAGSGGTVFNCAFENQGGTIEVQTGSLILQNTGTSSNGTFNVAAGATLDLTGGATATYCGRFSGGGLGVVQLASGEIDGNPSVSLDFPNGFYWRGGTFGWLCVNQGLMILEGAATRETTGTVDNYGTIRHTGPGDLWLHGFPATRYLINRAGAVYDAQADGTLVAGGNFGQLQNFGTVRKSGGSGVSRFDCAFQNLGGTLEVQAGTVQLTSLTHSNGTIRLQGGAAQLPAFALQAGRLEGTGVVSVAGTLLSSGTVAPGLSVGALQLDGQFIQTPGGTLAIELAGRNPGEFDRLNVTGDALLDGTLNVTVRPPFSPVPGDRFPVLSCANRTGTFGATNVPAGLTVDYATNGVFLVVTGAVAPCLSIARTATNSVVVSWPAPAEGWLLHATTKLVTGDSTWTEIPPPYQTDSGVISVNFTNTPPVGNQFFRLRKP